MSNINGKELVKLIVENGCTVSIMPEEEVLYEYELSVDDCMSYVKEGNEVQFCGKAASLVIELDEEYEEIHDNTYVIHHNHCATQIEIA